MSSLIAVTGKGGVGKTTIASLFVTSLLAAGKTPVLAIDADPNSCLDALLGVRAVNTVGRIREEAREGIRGGRGGADSGISKTELLELRITESLVESDGFDLIAMGRPEGAGCYCYANNVLKSVIARIAGQYPFVVLDNEAGLENLSRRIVQKVDLMVMVSDPSDAGLETVKRLCQLAGEMELEYGRLLLVVNKMRSPSFPKKTDEIIERTGADFVLGLADDDEIAALAESGASIRGLSADNAVSASINRFIRDSILGA
jgi:CO dehydrogenase maturation factor